MPRQLSLEEVRHVAALARLRLEDDELQGYRRQLSQVLEHIDRLQQVDVSGVEPMAHPLDLHNRLDDDEVREPPDDGRLLALAPQAVEGLIAVPRVLPDDEP